MPIAEPDGAERAIPHHFERCISPRRSFKRRERERDQSAWNDGTVKARD